jgi:signal transduction histidine kinase/CheY-like chemotaxis protein
MTEQLKRVHPIVGINSRTRIPTGWILLLVCGSVLIERPTSWLTWALLVGISLGWPHLAYFLAARSRDSKRAEHHNLIADAVLLGGWVGVISFSLWPTVGAVIISITAALSTGGPIMGLVAFVGMFTAAVIVNVAGGFGVVPEGSMLTAMLTMAGIVFYVVMLVFTVRRLAQQALARRNQLADQNEQIQRYSADLEAARQLAEHARQEAVVANQAKSQFLANMSHELRTPLNAIIGYSEMLIEEAEDTGQAAFTPDLAKIRSAGRHLLDLINEILDLSKIEAGKMEVYLETVSIPELIGGVTATVTPLAQKNGNRLVVEADRAPAVIRSDLTKLRQMLLNLLSNASKFTEGGTVTLTIEAEGPDVLFHVRDTGIGLTEQQQARLFQPFTQADTSTSRKFGGTGLGLTISRRFAHLLGGDITLVSRAGQGSTFTIRLPLEQAPTSAPATDPQAEPERRAPAAEPDARTVLVIDDDPHARDLLARALGAEGFRVLTAAGAAEGLRLARAHRPDIVTLDVLMPGTDGWTVLHALKEDPETAAIPVVMVSMVEDEHLGSALGAADYLTKPFDRERLVAAVRRLVPSGEGSGLILVIDDDARTRELLRRGLEGEGWEVAEAADGREALDLLDRLRPALVVLDLVLPAVDGFGVAERLRTAHPGVPIVVLTAYDVSSEDRHRLGAPATRILQKGISSQLTVLAEVRRLLDEASPTPA